MTAGARRLKKATGELVTLGEQDREAWDAALIAEGHRLVRESRAAYDQAIELASHSAELVYSRRRRAELA